MNREAELKRRALALGFDAVGIAPIEANPHAGELDQWLAAGYAGTMTYLHRQAAKRKDPRLIMPEARCAIVTLTNYCHDAVDSGSAPGARVAQYAWSTDYHEVIGARLERLAAVVADVAPGAITRTYVDAGPLPERDLAQRAGLGWIGKNTVLIHPTIGSFTFIGTVLTNAELTPDLPFDADRCGTCRACLDACPTDAFPTAHTLDARRCISYLTIERRGSFTAVEREQVGEWLFGCDVCQDVCPWNVRFARPTTDAEFASRSDVAHPDIAALASLSETEFAARYADTAFERAGADGLRRNAEAVLANGSRA
jgi:epoxyqueuosine reductase